MFGIIVAIVLISGGIVGCGIYNAQLNKDYQDAYGNWKHKVDTLKARGVSVDDLEEPTKPKKLLFPIYICVGVSVLVLIASCIAMVPTGYTGILTTFGKVEDRKLPSGISVIAPWQEVIKMDNRTQKVQVQTSAFSKDIQQVDIQMSINYCIDQATAQVLYRTVGINYYENVMYPRVQENTKAVFSQYSAEDLIGERDILSDKILDYTANDMKTYGITIVSIAIEDIDFTDAFTNAVEAKQVAAQNKLTAETQQAQKTMEEEAAAKRAIIVANAEAEKSIIAANADLEVVKVQAEAALYAGEKEAEMNKRISESLAGDIIQYYWIKQWDGILPTTILGGDASYMIDLTGGTNNGE